MIKYRAEYGTITKENIIKETDSFFVVVSSYWPKGRRERKESDTHKYFDSFEEAKNWLVDQQKLKLRRLNERINKESKVLIDIEELQEE